MDTFPDFPNARHGVAIAPYTTMRVGGAAAYLVETGTTEELVDAVRRADREGLPLFVLGGGSNVVVGDAGFDGVVVRTARGSIRTVGDGPGGAVLVEASAGTAWDALVSHAVDGGLSGIEALSGIPGQIGSAVMQNLGAYGQEMGAALVSARLLDRSDGSMRDYAAADLGLGYRTSMLRRSLEEVGGPWAPTPRWVVLGATFALGETGEGEISHAQLAHALGCEVGARMPLREVRDAVLEVRAAKGMVADPDPEGPAPLYDRWSSGSFFTNPVLDEADAARLLPDDAPRYPAGQAGKVKTSAAWLIDHAGFPKGYGVHGEQSAATLSRLHTLALTNRGAARASDVVELARAVRDGVRERFGVDLLPESVLVGVEL